MNRLPSLLPGLLLALLLSGNAAAQSQPILDRPVSLECRQQPLGKVLESIGSKGGFYFSYAGAILDKDSLVTLPLETRTVKQTLDLLFKGRLEYHANGRYLILLAAPPPAPPPSNRRWTITGVILDENTGERIGSVSVYDPDRLFATLTKEDGTFIVKTRTRDSPITLFISKESYNDTSIRLQPGTGGPLTIAISAIAFRPKASPPSSRDTSQRDTVNIGIRTDPETLQAAIDNNLIRVELTPWGRFLLSSRVRMHSINLSKFFVVRPIQFSLVPGLSTNGRLNSQVINNFSANVIGGYSAGLDGAEVGGIFNIDQKNVTGFQAAGILNIAGRRMTGMQAAGIANVDLDSVTGFQAAGIGNSAKQVDGAQAAGIFNTSTNIDGAQAAGIFNSAANINGMQAAGIFNTSTNIDGAQLAGVFNHTHHLKGLQLGLVNIADTCEGLSLGLVSIVRNGLHEFAFYADEWSPMNIAFRSGPSYLYSILLAGLNTDTLHRSWYYGYGLGHQFTMTPKLAIRSEISMSHVSPVDGGDFRTFLGKLNIDLHWRLAGPVSLSGGPSCTIYLSSHDYFVNGRLYQPVPKGYSTFSISERAIGWVGWRIAVNFF